MRHVQDLLLVEVHLVHRLRMVLHRRDQGGGVALTDHDTTRARHDELLLCHSSSSNDQTRRRPAYCYVADVLHVYLTGRVSLSRGEVTLGESELAGRLGRMVLVRLGLESHPIDRARLVDDLWAGEPPRGCDSMLNATFSRLRTAFTTLGLDGRGMLQSNGGAVVFQPPVGTRIDVAVATRSIDAAEGALRRNDLGAAWSSATVAHSISRRPLLPGVDLIWLDIERDRLHHVLERSLSVLCDVWLERGDPQQSATMAKELVRCAPYSESAHRRLVDALVALGDRPQAAHAVKRWNTIVTEELGLPASEGLRLPEPVADPSPARPERRLVGPEALTAAERRVALLVVEGFTNTQIAERLVLSRRTIDSHVLAAYRKLGVSSRVGLTRAMLDAAAD